VLARRPSADEVGRLVALYASEREHYRSSAQAAIEMASSELGAGDKSHDTAELAAWTVVSNVLLNLDETLNN
jgi:hypothetical protein